ncbi:hypothetical protein LABALGNA3A7_09740 [Dellaglioa algida]|nr:hypothetical protein LABALGNA3A7_09740 [Dellaglioa algida]
MDDARLKEIVKLAKMNMRIDWTDDDELIEYKIKRSFNYLKSKTGSELTFEDDSAELELVLERVRYDWNNSLDDFENNYKRELLSLIMEKALEAEQDGPN